MPWDPRIKRRLKLRDLDTLIAVARLGSMAKAAVHLSLSQPAVPKAIADMEATLGVRLLDRTARGVEPTMYGRALMKSGMLIFDDLRQGVEEIAFLADPTAGELRIGSTEPMAAGLVPAVIDRLSQRYPRISFHVIQTSPPSVQYQALRERQVELTVGRVPGPIVEDDFDVEVLFHERFWIVAAVETGWARRRTVKLSDLVDQCWLFPPPDTLVGSLMAEVFRENSLDVPNARVFCVSMQLQMSLVATGHFLTMMPISVLRLGANCNSIKALPIRLQQKPWPVAIIRLKNRTVSPAARLFIECAREVARFVKSKAA